VSYPPDYSGRWSIDLQPTIQLTSEMDVVRVTTDQPGHATFSGEDYFGDPVEQGSEISVDGTVTVSNGRIVWRPEG